MAFAVISFVMTERLYIGTLTRVSKLQYIGLLFRIFLVNDKNKSVAMIALVP